MPPCRSCSGTSCHISCIGPFSPLCLSLLFCAGSGTKPPASCPLLHTAGLQLPQHLLHTIATKTGSPTAPQWVRTLQLSPTKPCVNVLASVLCLYWPHQGPSLQACGAVVPHPLWTSLSQWLWFVDCLQASVSLETCVEGGRWTLKASSHCPSPPKEKLA